MLLLRAPYILTMTSSPIKNGAVVIDEDKILFVGPEKEIYQKYSSLEEINLPNSVLLPGFVNAHAHLELTSLRDFPYPGNFTHWIETLVQKKVETSDLDYEKGLHAGIEESLRSGTTTIADHVSFNTDLTTLIQSPLRGVLFLEVLGVVPEVAEEILKFAENFEAIFSNASNKMRVIASPHSAHALELEILQKVLKSDRSLFSIHLAESAEEDQLFKQKKGPLADFISQKTQKKLDYNQTSSIQYLNAQNLLSSKILAVHCNYIDETDIALLSQNQMSVVHCPSSHAYFSHQRFPLEKLLKQDINIALGTDSLASGSSLSMLDQIGLARKNYPEIKADKWLEMATIGGAKALKMENEIGSISPGKKGDLLGFQINAISSKSDSQIMEEIIKQKQADFLMINGQRIF